MTFTNFLQVLAFNLLSSTIPLCILLYVTAFLIAKMFERRFLPTFYESSNWKKVKKEDRKTLGRPLTNDED